MSEGWTLAESRRKEWRREAKRVIRKVINKAGCCSDTELAAALEKAYPFGNRDLQPVAYAVWMEQIGKLCYKRPMAETTPNPNYEFQDVAE